MLNFLYNGETCYDAWFGSGSWRCSDSSSGVTGMDRIRNEHIKGEVKVEQAGDKIAEARLRWLWHEQKEGVVGALGEDGVTRQEEITTKEDSWSRRWRVQQKWRQSTGRGGGKMMGCGHKKEDGTRMNGDFSTFYPQFVATDSSFRKSDLC